MKIVVEILLDEDQVNRLDIKETLTEEISLALNGVLNSNTNPRMMPNQCLDYEIFYKWE